VASDSEWQKQVPDMDAAAVGQIPTQTHTATSSSSSSSL